MITLPRTAPHRHRATLASARAIFALVLREMSTTYGRSPGGYLWAIAEPAAGILLLTLIFSIGFRAPALGTSFALFYAGGILPFLMFLDISNKLGQTLLFSKNLLSYPRITFVDALLARLILNTLTQLMVHFIILLFIVQVLDTHTVPDMGKIATAYGMVIALAAGIGTLNSFLTAAYPLGQTIWAITTRPLFIVSCIFFIFETVPRPYADYLWFNPLVHVVGQMRDGYFPFYHPSHVSVIYVLGLSAICLISGLLLLRRFHRDALLK